MTAVLRHAHGLPATTDFRPALDHHDRGTRALREVFDDTPSAAALRGRPELVVPLLERRLAKRPEPGHNRQRARVS